jgi:hypothetical protein
LRASPPRWALTHLRVSSGQDADVSGLTGLRRLAVRADWFANDWWDERCSAVEGLSGLTALEDLRLSCELGPLAQASDLAPLTALKRLAMTCVPPELASLPLAARLRRLELQAFGFLEEAPGGGSGSGANGAAAAALAALARGAPLLERLRIRVEDYEWDDSVAPVSMLLDHAGGVSLGPPLGPGVVWPSLEHLQVTAWAAVLLADCTFPRLSRLVARIGHRSHDGGAAAHAPLQAALATLAPKARDQLALRAAQRHFAAAVVPGLRHLSWACDSYSSGTAAPSASDWERLAPSLHSLELSAPLSACGDALAALTGLTLLHLEITSDKTSGKQPARVACALARLPRLAHLRLSRIGSNGTCWGTPAVAAELARCPALRLLEVERPHDPLWRHELGPAHGADPCVPRPSPMWPPFADALRAGGCRATVRPAPDSNAMYAEAFDIEI